MTEKIQALVLGTVRHSDRYDVVTLFTRTRGRIGVLSSAGGGRAGRLRNARLQPLSLIETDLTLRGSGGGLPALRAFSPIEVWHNLYFNPVRSSVGLFAVEFLGRLLRDSAPDPGVWRAVVEWVAWLDRAPVDSLSNWHVWLLVSLLGMTGIRPDTGSWRPGRWLDMREGVWRDFPPSHGDRLDPEESEVAVKVLRMTARTAGCYRFGREGRRAVVDVLLRYYAVHFPGVAGLRSPDILAEVFG